MMDCFGFLLRRGPPRSTRTDTLFRDTTHFRSADRAAPTDAIARRGRAPGPGRRRLLPRPSPPCAGRARNLPREPAPRRKPAPQIGRAHVCTPVTNAHLVCRLLLEKKTVGN